MTNEPNYGLTPWTPWTKQTRVSLALFVTVLLVAVQAMAQPVTSVSAGYGHSLFLKSDGSLWTMGRNDWGQLGDGTQPPPYFVNRPEQVLSNAVTAVDAGITHSLFLKSDGSLWAMGYNSDGQLGDGTFNNTNRPEQIVSSGVTAIAGGGRHSLFIKSDGSLWAMGQGGYGELGDGTWNTTNKPEQVVSNGVIAIAAGWNHSLFLKSDGSLWAMGENDSGELGDGTKLNRNNPGQIVSNGVVAIAAGYEHSLFLKSNGSLWAMGKNFFGELGDGTTTDRAAPVQIVSNGVTTIAGGGYHSLFLKSDGSLWAMGWNQSGQLGDGTTNNANKPKQIVPSGVVAIAGGISHSLFIRSDGTLWGMGENASGELGDGTPIPRYTPISIVPGPPAPGPVGQATGQTFRVLHNFSPSSWSAGMTNWDGAQPYNSGVILSGNKLYGTTYYGGVNGNGTVFSVNTDGSDFAVLHTFGATPSPDYTNSDGAAPQGGLVLLGDTLYGTALYGGTNSGGYGTIFSVSTNGGSFVLIHSFDGVGGCHPVGPLVIANNRIYGVTESCGPGQGTVFGLNLDGTDFTVLHAFTSVDGRFPYAGLMLSGDSLYGTAEFGGANGNGTVFAIKTNGTDFTLLHTFTAGAGPYNALNDDGMYPETPLVISGDTVYGTALFGGANHRGTLFSVKTNGADFAVLHTFSDLNGSFNLDGAYPEALLLFGSVLYGVTSNGGTNGNGVVYSINTDGRNFTVLYSFSPWYDTNFDGAYPEGALVRSGNTLYGTAEQGGAGNGTVFSLSFAPQLTLTRSETNVVLTWPTNVAGFDYTGFALQSTTDLTPSASWTPVSPAPVLTAGRNAVTNPITGTKQFYRLIH